MFGHTDSDMNERNLENGASFQKNSWQEKKKWGMQVEALAVGLFSGVFSYPA